MKKFEVSQEVVEADKKDKEKKKKSAQNDYVSIKSKEIKQELKKLGTSENPMDDVERVGNLAKDISNMALMNVVTATELDNLKSHMTKKKQEKFEKMKKEAEIMQKVFSKIASNFENMQKEK